MMHMALQSPDGRDACSARLNDPVYDKAADASVPAASEQQQQQGTPGHARNISC